MQPARVPGAVAKPLVVVDLHSLADPLVGAEVVRAHHRHTSPDRKLHVVGPDAAATDFHGAGGIQVTGSPLMLNTRETAWAPSLSRRLEAAAQDGVPVLGVCFGHQMLGSHFGGVLRSWPEERWGVADVTFDAVGPFAAVSGAPVEVVFTHRDWLETVPAPLRPVAQGGLGGVQAFAHRELPLWGIQGHPEADMVLAVHSEGARWTRYASSCVDTPTAKAILGRFGQMMR